MMNAINLIAASAIGSGKPGGGLVKAVVSGGPDSHGTFTLRLENGQEIGIQINDKNAAASLKTGMNVSISLSDGKIIISEGQQQTEQSSLSEQARQASAPTKHAPVLISVNIAMSPQKAAEGFESPLLKSIPAEVIERIVNDRGGMSAEILNVLTKIDNLLKGRSIAVDPASQSQVERIEQWLRIALDNPKSADELVERIPVNGAKDVGELIDKLLKLTMTNTVFDTITANKSGTGKDTLFAMMNNTSSVSGKGAYGNNPLSIDSSLLTSNNKADLIPQLSKTAFNTMPTTLLNIVKHIDTSPQQGASAGNVKLPPVEAQRLVADVAAKLTAQPSISSTPEILQDGKRLSPVIVSGEVDVTPMRKTEPQIRMPASAPTTPPPIQTTTSVRTTTPPVQAQTPLVQTSQTNVRTATPSIQTSTQTPSVQTSQTNVRMTTPSIQTSTQTPSVQTSQTNVRTAPASTPPIQTSTQTQAQTPTPAPVQAQAQTPPPSAVIPQIKAIYATITESAVRILTDVGSDAAVQKSAPAYNAGLNATVDIKENLEIMRELIDKIQVDSEKPIAVDKPLAANKDFSEYKSAAVADKTAVTDKPVSGNTTVIPEKTVYGNTPVIPDKPIVGDIQPPMVADKPIIAVEKLPASSQPSQPPVTDVPAIKNTAILIIDNLRAVVEAVINKFEHSAESARAAAAIPAGQSVSESGNTVIDTGERLQLLGAVRDAIVSLENALRPLEHEEHPVPQKFYERVSGDTNQRQIAAESRASVFAQISAAQGIVRQLIESAATPPHPSETPADTATALPRTDFSNNTSVQTAQRIWVITENLHTGFRDAFSSLELQNRVTPVSVTDASSTQIIRQGIDSLRTEILLEVSGAIREIFSSLENLRANVSPLLGSNGKYAAAGKNAEINGNAAGAVNKSGGIEDAIIRAVMELERQAQRSGIDIADRLKDVLKELSRLQVETSKSQQLQTQSQTQSLAQPQNQNIGDGTAHQSSPADVIRSAALTAARTLESLSLLSTQTRGTDSQQQIVALPVKIGQEWAEVQIKIIKDRRSGKNKDGAGKDGHVSVYLNTAPSNLGEIVAHFDFHPPASLKLAIRFEKPEVTKWFREQAAELKDALAQAGLPGTALTFHSKRTANKKVDDAAGKHVNVIKDGKVDFKI